MENRYQTESEPTSIMHTCIRMPPDLKQGDKVKAGSLLGYMGIPAMANRRTQLAILPLHLHLGIYIRTDHYEELSVNPYWILKYLEKYKLKYDY